MNNNISCDGSARGWCGKESCDICHKTSDALTDEEAMEHLKDENNHLRTLLGLKHGEIAALKQEVEQLKASLDFAQETIAAADAVFDQEEHEEHRKHTASFREIKKESKFHRNRAGWSDEDL